MPGLNGHADAAFVAGIRRQPAELRRVQTEPFRVRTTGVCAATAATVALVAAESALAVLAWAPAYVPSFVVSVGGAALGPVFTAAQTYALATGQRVSGLCFGARSAEPVSVHTLAKAALVLACGLVLVALGDSAAGGGTTFGFWEMAIALGAVAVLSVTDARRRSASGPGSAIA